MKKRVGLRLSYSSLSLAAVYKVLDWYYVCRMSSEVRLYCSNDFKKKIYKAMVTRQSSLLYKSAERIPSRLNNKLKNISNGIQCWLQRQAVSLIQN